MERLKRLEPKKQKSPYLFWLAIFLSTILLVILDKHLGKLYPFIWSMLLIPSIFVVMKYPTYKVIIRTGIFCSFLKYTVEMSHHTFISSDIIALVLGSLINWTLHLLVGYIIVKYNKALIKIEQMTVTDALTEIYNRRYFESYMEKATPLSEEMTTPLLLILFDIDHFKKINDTYGHQCGDEIIKQVVEVVKRNIREPDIFARMGGEEFAIVMPETSQDDGVKIAERIRMEIEKTKLKCEDKQIHVTISLGLSIFKNEKVYDFIERTDKALYQAKTKGRNQLIFL